MQMKCLMAALALCVAGGLPPAHAASDAEASKVCIECHDDLPDMSRSAHAVATDPRTPSCISCHGPSQSHAVKEKGKKQGAPDRVFKGEDALPAAERSAVCLTCHNQGSKLALWAGSQHPTTDVAATRATRCTSTRTRC